MKNLYSPYKGDSFEGYVRLRLMIISIFTIICLVFLLIINDFNFVTVPSILFLIFFISIPLISINSYIQIRSYLKEAFVSISDQSSAISQGNFEKRITGITSNNEFAKMAWQINDVTDQFEAFMKEIDTSTQYASEHKFFRKPMHQGLRGMLKQTIKNVSVSLDFQAETNILIDLQSYLDRSTNLILQAIEAFTQGDLTISIQKERDGDVISKIIDSFNEMVKAQEQIIIKISDAVEATASASAEISASAEEMAAGAQEQSSQTAEVTISVEHVTATIMETTENTNKAAEEANHSKVIAEKGGIVFSELENGMNNIAEVVMQSSEIVNRLGKSGEKIGEIIQVIDDIADQTNLLALNAAIEAARAGEQGRGFAVVADEVRKLAERTTKSTKEIADMIKTIQDETKNAVDSMYKGRTEVENGKVSVRQAGQSLSEIIVSSNKVMGIVRNVAEASKGEADEAEQISHNISGINTVAHETAIGVEQIAQASEDLNRLTENLQTLISKFTLSNNQLISLPKN
ncbi:MAG: methyl-accepting chemotaxis protein [Bacteroidetes bacterium]|nr:methyl-accepting chemotaxis protein [Bacteroidota bacterium]MBU1113669.1 methyl-accepting chemotaxis protein [Bacteroidota bacterium]MBU1796745.1 methyl-accepting chemotaxis protein [Bacteroidota bacterium]